MITEVITFKLRAGMTREDVVAIYRKTAPIWRANPECIRKCYLYDGRPVSRHAHASSPVVPILLQGSVDSSVVLA